MIIYTSEYFALKACDLSVLRTQHSSWVFQFNYNYKNIDSWQKLILFSLKRCNFLKRRIEWQRLSRKRQNMSYMYSICQYISVRTSGVSYIITKYSFLTAQRKSCYALHKYCPNLLSNKIQMCNRIFNIFGKDLKKVICDEYVEKCKY